MSREELQERLYSIPYHFLPWVDGNVWRVGRFLGWAFEYLALVDTVIRMVSEALPNSEKVNLLDFGCGDGRLIWELFQCCPQKFGSIVGVDISERALSFAKAVTYGKEHVKFFSSMEQVKRSGQLFDVVVAMEVLEHIPPNDLKGVVKDIATVVKDEGSFVVSVPTRNVPLNPKHYQHFCVSDLVDLVLPFFILEKVSYIHRVGLLSEVVRRFVINRFFIANHRIYLAFWTWIYKRFAFVADEKTGAHLVCRFRKRFGEKFDV